MLLIDLSCKKFACGTLHKLQIAQLRAIPVTFFFSMTHNDLSVYCFRCPQIHQVKKAMEWVKSVTNAFKGKAAGRQPGQEDVRGCVFFLSED